MKMADIRTIAKEKGIKTPRRAKKADLIRRIQEDEEGSLPCFGTAMDYCDQLACCWRVDCLGLSGPLSGSM